MPDLTSKSESASAEVGETSCMDVVEVEWLCGRAEADSVRAANRDVVLSLDAGAADASLDREGLLTHV